MRLYGLGVAVWQLPSDLATVGFLATRIPAADRKWLFFTEERSLEEVAAARSHPWLATAIWHPGPGLPTANCPQPVPVLRPHHVLRPGYRAEDNSRRRRSFSAFGGRVSFRYRFSWVEGRKTPRIRLIFNRTRWQAAGQAGLRRRTR
jgi:hypothetical protein